MDTQISPHRTVTLLEYSELYIKNRLCVERTTQKKVWVPGRYIFSTCWEILISSALPAKAYQKFHLPAGPGGGFPASKQKRSIKNNLHHNGRGTRPQIQDSLEGGNPNKRHQGILPRTGAALFFQQRPNTSFPASTYPYFFPATSRYLSFPASTYTSCGTLSLGAPEIFWGPNTSYFNLNIGMKFTFWWKID